MICTVLQGHSPAFIGLRSYDHHAQLQLYFVITITMHNYVSLVITLWNTHKLAIILGEQTCAVCISMYVIVSILANILEYCIIVS